MTACTCFVQGTRHCSNGVYVLTATVRTRTNYYKRATTCNAICPASSHSGTSDPPPPPPATTSAQKTRTGIKIFYKCLVACTEQTTPSFPAGFVGQRLANTPGRSPCTPSNTNGGYLCMQTSARQCVCT